MLVLIAMNHSDASMTVMEMEFAQTIHVIVIKATGELIVQILCAPKIVVDMVNALK